MNGPWRYYYGGDAICVGGGRLLKKHLTLIYCILQHASYLITVLKTNPNYLIIAYSRFLTWVVESLLTTPVEGLEVCWLHNYYYYFLPNDTSMRK